MGGAGPGLLAAVSGLPLLTHLSVSYFNLTRVLERVAVLDALPVLGRCHRLSRLDLLYMAVRAEQVRLTQRTRLKYRAAAPSTLAKLLNLLG